MCCCRIPQPWHCLGPRCRLLAMPSCVACLPHRAPSCRATIVKEGSRAQEMARVREAGGTPTEVPQALPRACAAQSVSSARTCRQAGGMQRQLAGRLCPGSGVGARIFARGCNQLATCQHPIPCIAGHKGPNEGRSVPCEKCSPPQCEILKQPVHGRSGACVLCLWFSSCNTSLLPNADARSCSEECFDP